MKTMMYSTVAVFTLACFAIAQQMRAACQQGCLTNNNTVLGDDALLNNTGADNTAVGNNALLNNTTGDGNTANGTYALFSNTTGIANTGIGGGALLNNTTGDANTAIGSGTLFNNTEGIGNIGIGSDALFGNVTGNFNTAIGGLSHNTTGSSNTAVGGDALEFNTTGDGNAAVGQDALQFNAEGSNNTAVGNGALVNSTGSTNIALGFGAGQNLTTGDNNIDIGNDGVSGEADTIRIGMQGAQTRTFIAGISSASGTGRPVVINAAGRLAVAPSSQRFKEEIKPMGAASEVILALKPVTFRYKKQVDPDRTPEFGLVAEEVEKVNPDLVARDGQGKPFTVRYEAVNAMLLNEFLKAHRKIEEQGAILAEQRTDFEAAIAEQKQKIQTLTAGLKEQASQIQKVAAQIEVTKPSSQTASLPGVVPRLRDEGGNNQ